MVAVGLIVGVVIGALAAYLLLSRKGAGTAADLRAAQTEIDAAEARLDMQTENQIGRAHV